MANDQNTRPLKALAAEISDMAAQMCVPILAGLKDDPLAVSDAKWALANAAHPRPNARDVIGWKL